jgi:hypothetical protein
MRRALVVGIDRYPLSPLQGCANDARDVEIVLRKNGDGSPNFDTLLLRDPPDTITRAVLRERLRELFGTECDIALLYFSGHGTMTSTGGYLVTPDAKQFDEGILMDEVLTLANNSPATSKIAILDCCNSGAFGSPQVTGSTGAYLGRGLTVLSACNANESALESGGHGVFTSLLLDALKGGGADLRGNVTPGSLYAYVDEALGAWDQRPIFKANISRFTAIRRTEPPIPIGTLRRITTYFPSPESEYRLDPSYEFTSEHPVVERVAVLKDLQKYASVHLVRPVGEEYMYFAAMNSKSCRLTDLGYQYWRLVKENKL